MYKRRITKPAEIKLDNSYQSCISSCHLANENYTPIGMQIVRQYGNLHSNNNFSKPNNAIEHNNFVNKLETVFK